MQDQVAVRPAPPAKAKPEDIGKSAEFYLWVGVLLGVILLAAFIIAAAGRYRRRGEEGESIVLTLSDYRDMLENGEITEAEYEKIRARLGGVIKTELGVEPPPPRPPKSE